MIGLGVKLFFKDIFNSFDLVVVILSLIELFIGYFSDDSGGGALSALRAFRLLRIFKLARRNYSLKLLLDSIIKTIGAMGNFSILLGLVIYVFALLGESFFAGRLRFDDLGYPQKLPNGDIDRYADFPHSNFESIWDAIITIFQILSGENWNEVMYDCGKANGIGAFI